MPGPRYTLITSDEYDEDRESLFGHDTPILEQLPLT